MQGQGKSNNGWGKGGLIIRKEGQSGILWLLKVAEGWEDIKVCKIYIH